MHDGMYSQQDEERFILQAVGTTPGRFLDIGASDGETLSNTMRLVLNGWTGVYVEPSPYLFKALLAKHAYRTGMSFYQVALAPQAGFTTFWLTGGDNVNTLDPTHKQVWANQARVHYTATMVYAVTPSMLFSSVGFDFEFINLDVEGLNVKLFNQLPLKDLTKLKCLCVEREGQDNHMTECMANHGFRCLATTPENLIYAR